MGSHSVTHRCNKRSDENFFKTLERGKIKKKTFDKNVADICHESNYYLRTLSHM